jgi:ADP-dependent phosphofructokinase/glucokinase
MTQQAEILQRIDKILPKYTSEIIDFVGYLEYKSRQGKSPVRSVVLTEEQKEREKKCFELNAEELNREAMDVLSYQVPIFPDESEDS